ncbi:hypothetical protein U1Q18_011176 [Sarracenia purpurea var. burkii]
MGRPLASFYSATLKGATSTLVEWSRIASQLKRLQIVVCLISDKGLSEDAKKLPLLEELCIRYCSISKEALKNVGCCCHKLKALTFYDRGFRGSYDMKYYDDEARAIAENMPGLHYLRLIGHGMTDDGLSAILDGVLTSRPLTYDSVPMLI